MFSKKNIPNLSKVFLLTIFPFCFFYLREIFVEARGPFWLGMYVDPSYTYLLNSLNLAFYSGGIGHTDHPGTPIQIIGAIVIIIVFIYRFIRFDLDYGINEGIQLDVLKNPEIYLDCINYTFLIINICLLLSLGYLVYKKTKRISYALIVQSIPFYSFIFARNVVAEVSAEPLLFTACYLFLGVAFLLQVDGKDKYFKLYLSDTPNKQYKLLSDTLYLGILSGLGLAIKLPFLSYWFIAILFIWNWKELIKYFFIALLSFFAFTIFSFFRLPRAFAFWSGMATHTGIYGSGEVGLIKVDTFIDNLQYMSVNNPLFVIFTLIATIVTILNLKNHSSLFSLLKNKQHRFRIALYVGLLINILITCKHFAPRYLLSSFCILPFLTITILASIKDQHTSYFRWVRIALVALAILIVPLTTWNMYHYEQELTEIKELQHEQYESVQKDLKKGVHFFAYRNSHPVYALREGDAFARLLNSNSLKELYGDFYYYNHSLNLFYKWDQELSISEILALKKDIYVTGSDVNVQLLEKAFKKKATLHKNHQTARTYLIKK